MCRPSFTKSLSLVLIRLVSTEIQRYKRRRTQRPDGLTFFWLILTVKTSPINNELGDFAKLGPPVPCKRKVEPWKFLPCKDLSGPV